jgi:hypothetical protein
MPTTSPPARRLTPVQRVRQALACRFGRLGRQAGQDAQPAVVVDAGEVFVQFDLGIQGLRIHDLHVHRHPRPCVRRVLRRLAAIMRPGRGNEA